jgi:hypothetical protein
MFKRIVLSLLLINTTIAFNHRHKLLGTWKINKRDTSIDISRNKIKIITKEDIFGSFVTVQKQLYGCYNIDTNIKTENESLIFSSLCVKLSNKTEKLDSILGIEVNNNKLESVPVIGTLDFKITFISDDVILAETQNKIKGCKEYGDKDYILIRDKQISSALNPVPLNIFLIGQILGFSSSHILDFIWSLIYHSH